MNRSITNPGDIADGLVTEILEVVNQYDGAITLAGVIGCLEIAKMHIMDSHTVIVEEEEDDD